MNAALWVASGLLAGLYLLAGGTKLLQSRDKLVAQANYAWANDFSGPVIKAIGGLEILGAVGLVLPWLTDIAHVLTPVAATGLALLQVGALATHARRGETKVVPLNAVLLLLAVFIAVGRYAAWGTA